MLKSTHRPVEVPLGPPLPPPWTEHKAPTGHTYYYNPETKQSTYARPIAPPPQPEPLHYDPSAPNGWSGQPAPGFAAQFGAPPTFRGRQQQHGHPRRQPQDRPKSMHPVPGHAPWVVVKTRLGRRFVHNPETEESFWRVPEQLIPGLVEFDIAERLSKERRERGEAEPRLAEVLGGAEIDGHDGQEAQDADEYVEGSEDYEEVEVTDSEHESNGHPPKRRRMSEPEAAEVEDEDEQYMIDEEDEEERRAEQALGELGEEDMAAQLAEMGQSYELDPTEYYNDADYLDGDGEAGEGLGAYGLTEAEAQASFKDMLDDAMLNPYSTWDNILDSHSNALISDERYTLLPNMRSRREVFATWSSEKITASKAAKEKQIKLNPRIPYLRLLEHHASAKLYWPEFKRKFKREPEMKEQRALGDKEREKLYRDFISRTTKMSEEQRKRELEDLMRSIPPSKSWNRGSNAEGVLPDALLADVRYVTVKANIRDPMIMDFVKTLPRAEEVDEGLTEEEQRQHEEREKREHAMRRRNEEVEARKRDQEKDLAYGQRRLRAEEMELERATRVGRGGLRENLET